MEQVEQVTVPVASVRLAGSLTIPQHPKGLVVFAHGSGSSRLSPRNRFVAQELNGAGLVTLLFDLLTPLEEQDRGNVFDIDLLGGRLSAATDWLRRRSEMKSMPIGFFGASTGAAAALWSAAEPNARISAVVSRGGRPDLAGTRLGLVAAPTLLIVGSRDRDVEKLNKEAQARLQCENRLEIVPGATHLFEEPGTLEEVAALACKWFLHHLSPIPSSPHGDNTARTQPWDPKLESAREEAEGTELFEDPRRHRTDQIEREQAQGVEVFADPDATLPAVALAEGAPGHETFTGDQAGMAADEDTDHQRADESGYN